MCQEEECDISERAEEYSSTILPHEHYFLLQENIQETEVQDSETFTEVTNFVYNNPLMVQKKRRRSYSNIDRFVTHDVNYSESAQILPEGFILLLKQIDLLMFLMTLIILYSNRPKVF